MADETYISVALRTHIGQRADDPILHYQDAWYDWRWLGEACDALARAADGAPIIGLVARNRPLHIATIAGNVRDRRTTAFIYSAQRTSGIAADIASLRLPVIVADRDDWDASTLEAARRVGSIAIATNEKSRHGFEIFYDPCEPAMAAGGEVAFLLLSSGTTGPPKRVPLNWATVSALVADARTAYVGSGDRRSPQIMAAPLGNVSGLVYTLPPLVFGDRIVLLDRFEPEAWGRAVRDHRPTRGAMTPTGARMLLASGIPPAWLASLDVIGVGGSQLDVSLQLAFEQHFHVPLLPAFGATEFGGVIANWFLDTYRTWGEIKRGSVGRAAAGVVLRIVDAAGATVSISGDHGLLEAKVDRIGPDWIRTTDLASIDADGFLFIHGRADGVINRGGFKVVPEAVAAVIRRHPQVADAVVIGLVDQRLGEVPVAAVERVAGRSLVEDALRVWLKDQLLSYEVPVKILLVDGLPRNASAKVDLVAVRSLF